MRKTPTIVVCLVVLATITGCASMLQQGARQAAERRQAYVQTHVELDDATRNRILQGKVAIGMTTEQVIASWGRPHDINRTVGSWGVHEQWVYGYTKYYGSGVSGFVSTSYLYFENGLLTSWQD